MNSMTYNTSVLRGQTNLATVRQLSLVTAQKRLLLLMLIFGVAALMAIVRIGWLGASGEGGSAASLSEALLPPRGEITDRNGTPLARAFPAYSLWYNPDAMGDPKRPLVNSPEQVAASLKAIFPDMDEEEVAKRLASGKRGYLRRRLLPEDANRVHDLGELALEIPQETDRHYPQGSMAAHVLGYVAADGHGRVGMEQVLDKQLLDPAQRGEPVALSIDMRVQGALEDELRKGMLANDATAAAGVILDVDTGEVMALASLPEFNPNRIDERGEKYMFNQVTNQVYELGSTFKPITIASAIDAGVVRDFGRRYESGRPIEISGFKIRDSHSLGPTLNVPETLIHSSNIVTAHIADELGAERLRKTMIDLGMNERPYIELPARGMPIWPGENWGRARTMTVSYGHGIAVTPLHLASAYAALVNGGVWRPATMYKLDPGSAPRGRRVFKASTSSRIRQLLRMTVVFGTGKNADAAGYRVGGKTGSAEKPGKGGYRRKSLISTFAAVFPMDRPRYAVLVMLDEPQGTAASSYQRTAAWNAAPIVGKLIPRIGPVLGVQPDGSRDIDLSDLRPLVPGAGH